MMQVQNQSFKNIPTGLSCIYYLFNNQVVLIMSGSMGIFDIITKSLEFFWRFIQRLKKNKKMK